MSQTSQMLSLSFRPKTLDEMVGQKSLVKRLRKQIAKRVPAAFMFIGESGAGKTTLARIVATALQCKHQSEFGNPCSACQKGSKSKFDFIEINAAEYSGVSEVEQIISGAFYNPKPPSLYRVYLFDEAHNLSKPAQTALLKYFEDSPRTTIWMIATTAPQSILRTLRRRCMRYPLLNLTVNGVGVLVSRTIKFSGSNKDPEPLTEALLESGVTSPGFIVQAVEQYLAGEKPEKAAQGGFDSSVNTLQICREVVKGDWSAVRELLFAANPEDARAIRYSVAGYLKKILIDSDTGSMANRCAEGIRDLTTLTSFEDGVQLSGTIAVLYNLCRVFGGNRERE
jgi:hypothetical protein